MDVLNRKLLNELQSQGFQRSTILASRLNIGERTIRRRIRAMRSTGIIKIIALPNPVLSGYKAWAKIGIKVEPGSLFHVANELVEHPSIYFVAYSLGVFDITIAVQLETMHKLTYFVNAELTRVKGILSTETMILMYPRKYYNFSWPEPAFRTNDRSEHYREVTTGHNAYVIDDTDRRIIDMLVEDAFTPVKVLKSRLGIGEVTIRKRIKKMLKEEVFKIEVVPNPKSLEYEVWATMGLVISHQFAQKVINAIIKNPAVYLAAVSIGRFNIIISARFHNIDSLNEFVNVKLAEIKGVSAIETFLHTKPLKYHNTKW